MKIGIVTFNTDKRNMAGIITAPLYMSQLLNTYSKFDVDIVSTKPKTKHDLDGIKYPDATTSVGEFLNYYDFLIFSTPGFLFKKKDMVDYNVYDYIFDELETPFSIVINEERDGQLYNHFDEFTKHDNYCLLMLNSEDMHLDFEYLLPRNGQYFEFNYISLIKSKEEILDLAEEKLHSTNRSIISTSRWVNRKRVLELAQISKDLHCTGIETFIAGDRKTYFYFKEVLTTNVEFWTDLKPFMPEDLEALLKPHMFHYDFVYVKRESKNRKMRGRLELVTIEALNSGCLPVLCSQSVPSWLLEGKSAIVLDKDDLDKLPNILSNMSDQDYLARVSKFYDLVDKNINGKYLSFISTIEQLVTT